VVFAGCLVVDGGRWSCKLWVNKGKRVALPLSHDFETYGSGIAYFIKVVLFYPVTPVLQLGWVGIDLIDSDVSILNLL
jgi:hypothetical protein